MADLEVKNPLQIRGWDNWAASIPEANIFHSAQWARVLHETYGYTPLYFVSGMPAGLPVLVPVMEVSSGLTGKRGVSLPFTDSCKSLVHPDIDPGEIRKSILRYGSLAGWRSLEARDSTLSVSEIPFSSEYYVHSIELRKDLESHFKTLKHGTRTSIRKAQREGLQFSTSQSSESLELFYRLNCITRRKHGLPPQPIIFFRKLQEQIISKNLGYVAEVAYKGRVVSAAVCLQFANEAIVKYAAFDPQFQKLRPNNLLIWSIIQWHGQKGYGRLSLGRSSLHNPGLRRFKLGWKLDEGRLRYYRFDMKENQLTDGHNPLLDMSAGILRNMPVPALRVIGRILYKHMG